jgi:putative endonuclease
MAITQKRNFGNWGEKIAAKYLQNKGYKILDANFQNGSGRRLGEIDIIALDKKSNELVFAEVKTRELNKYSDTNPEENITFSKLHKMEKIAQTYLKIKKSEDSAWRFDALSVWLDAKNKRAKIKHIIGL